MAALVLVLFVLPAEFGVDPTGVGKATGVAKLREAPPAAVDDASPAPPPVLLQSYESRFDATTTRLLAREDALVEGETRLVTFDVPLVNVTRVAARLAFVDDNATPNGERTGPDTFEIELKTPYGDVSPRVLVRSDPATGGGSGEAVFVVRQPPHPRLVDAANADEAREAFARNDPPDATATGAWTARVTLLEAQDGRVQGAHVPGVAGTAASDDGNAWTLTIVAESYELSVAAKPGTQQRSDVATLTLPPGAEAEYKLAMTMGKRVDWAWRTNGPVVYVDFHGEKSGDAEGAFTRHKNGDYASDAGTLVAPFDGRHGWYWRNASGQSVTITLETRGQYDVIGRV